MSFLLKSFVQGHLCEFAIPEKDHYDLVVFLPGLPSYPRPKKLMLDLVKQGYAVLYPRYLGTFESAGSFL